jgi:hypothetical protein
LLSVLPSFNKLHPGGVFTSSNLTGVRLVPAHDGKVPMLLLGSSLVLGVEAGSAGAALAKLLLLLLSSSLATGVGASCAGAVMTGLLPWTAAAVVPAAAAPACSSKTLAEAVAPTGDLKLKMLPGALDVVPTPAAAAVHDSGSFSVSPALIAVQPGLASQMAL